jgi:restriction system protein
MPEPPDHINANISPVEFELLVRDFLSNVGKELTSFVATHNTVLNATDGQYQIDVYGEFDFLGVTMKVLVECKRYKSKVKRDVVQLLYDKLRATGSQKGIVFATSGFQEGAITFASQHGIALVRVIEGRYTYFTKSQGSPNFEPPPWANLPKYVGEYRNDNITVYLQEGYLDDLAEFLFSKSDPL